MITTIKFKIKSKIMIVGNFNTPLTPRVRSPKRKFVRKHKTYMTLWTIQI